jgi:hypothetical protein
MSFFTNPSRIQFFVIFVAGTLFLLAGCLLPLGTRAAIRDDDSLSCQSKAVAWGYMTAFWVLASIAVVIFFIISFGVYRCVQKGRPGEAYIPKLIATSPPEISGT